LFLEKEKKTYINVTLLVCVITSIMMEVGHAVHLGTKHFVWCRRSSTIYVDLINNSRVELLGT